MAASLSYVNMCLRSLRSLYNISPGFISAFHRSYYVQQRLSYPATSILFNQNTSTAEKSQTTDNASIEENSAEVKQEVTEREKSLLAENEKLLESVKTLDDKYKRSLAENENVRIRMRREVSDARQYGIQNFVKDLVEVADVLEKATETVPKDALQSNTHLKNLFEGLQMTEAQLQSVLKRYGVKQINPIGEKFDPNCHEALFEQEDSSKEPGTVGTVTKVGYRLHDRVVRPAMVGVIKAHT